MHHPALTRLARTICIVGLCGVSARGDVLTVGPQGRYPTPVAALAAAAGVPGPHEIVLENGLYRLKGPLVLTARHNGLTIRAREAGRAILTGSVPVTGWRPEAGTPFVSAPVPKGVFFRSLIVGGKSAPRAEFPGNGVKLENENVWTVRWMSSAGNGWERPPTQAELTQVRVKDGDIPAGMDFSSADVRVYHEWDDSLVRAAAYDASTRVLALMQACRFPPGSFRKHGYVIYNVREGLKAPGQWYLASAAGRLFYWPKPEEAVQMPAVEIPETETLLTCRGAKDVRISGIVFENARAPAQRASFGGAGIPAAVYAKSCLGLTIGDCVFRNNGGIGLFAGSQTESRILRCTFRGTGSCAAQINGSRCEVRGCRFVDSGTVFTSAAGLHLQGNGMVFAENEISGAPYCGVCLGGCGNLFESNRVDRVMQLLNDGAAFYGMSRDCVFRGNVVRDDRRNDVSGSRHAFYSDESSCGNLVVDNLVEADFRCPIQNHMTRDVVVSGNVFRATGDVSISFFRSRGGVFVENRIETEGGRVIAPDAIQIARWAGNRIRVGGVLTNVVPRVRILPPRKVSIPVPKTLQPPRLDGRFDGACWPGVWQDVNRTASGEDAGGPPHLVRACCTDKDLYVAVRVATFGYEPACTNAATGLDGVTLSFPKLEVEGFADGSSRNAAAFRGGVEVGARGQMGPNMLYVFRLPWETLGGMVENPRFNCTIRDARHRELRYWDVPGRVHGRRAAGESGTAAL